MINCGAFLPSSRGQANNKGPFNLKFTFSFETFKGMVRGIRCGKPTVLYMFC